MKYLIGLAVAVAVVLGGYFVINQHSTSDAPANTDGASMEQEASEGAFEGSLADLSRRGGNWKCVVETTANTGAGSVASSGTVYVSGEKVRADFTSEVPGFGVVDAYMIADGAYVYSWTSMTPQGVKTEMVADTEETTEDVPTSGSGYDPNHSYEYDCQMATADASLFVVPGDVTFIEY